MKITKERLLQKCIEQQQGVIRQLQQEIDEAQKQEMIMANLKTVTMHFEPS